MEDDVCLVLGASGGIGAELSRRLHRRGVRLMLAGRNEPALMALAAEVGAQSYVLDATDPVAIDGAVQATLKAHDRLDTAANCVGSFLLKPAHATSPEDWHHTMATNLTSAFGLVRAGARAMMARGGSIVLVSSAAARIGLANHEAIAAAKAGIEGLARSAAATYGPKGVRVNVVAPGLTETSLTTRITGNENAANASRRMHVLGRLGQPEDVAATMDYLLSDQSSWITGQVVGVDGGLSAVRSR